jgi:hypothetical protein
VNDIEQRIKQLLNESVDAQLGPRRPAPPFEPRRVKRLRRVGPWAAPLIAVASVAAVVGGTIGVAHLASSGHHPQPGRSVPSPTPAQPKHSDVHSPEGNADDADDRVAAQLGLEPAVLEQRAVKHAPARHQHGNGLGHRRRRTPGPRPARLPRRLRPEQLAARCRHDKPGPADRPVHR